MRGSSGMVSPFTWRRCDLRRSLPPLSSASSIVALQDQEKVRSYCMATAKRHAEQTQWASTICGAMLRLIHALIHEWGKRRKVGRATTTVSRLQLALLISFGGSGLHSRRRESTKALSIKSSRRVLSRIYVHNTCIWGVNLATPRQSLSLTETRNVPLPLKQHDTPRRR